MHSPAVFEILAQYTSADPQGGAGFMGGNLLYYILFGGMMLLSMAVSGMLQHRFRVHSQHPIRHSGAEIAEMMLRQNGIHDVKVVSVGGQLTDHYHPHHKTVNLSESVYAQRNAAAAAVAAHEVGHAVQHAKGYAPLQFRSAMVPAVSFGSKIAPLLILVGMVMMSLNVGWWILAAGVALFGLSSLFSLITLPVEFDASRRALAWIDSSRVMDDVGHDKAKNALFWAAMTYVVGALAALAQLGYFVMMLLGARRSE